MKKVFSLIIIMTMIISLFAVPVFGTTTNFIVNGDFESGNGAFYSDYGYFGASLAGTDNPPEYNDGMLNEGYYTISDSPNKVHKLWTFGPFADHTNGHGNMMIINGQKVEEEHKTVWEQTVNLPEYNGEPSISFDLVVGRKNVKIGTVDLETREDGFIYVRYTITGDLDGTSGWLLTEMHVDVATTQAELKQNKSKNPQVGLFALNMSFDPGVLDTQWQKIPNTEGMIGELFVAAHAGLERKECVTVVEAGFANIISDTSTMVTNGNAGTFPHPAVESIPTPGYSADTWTKATGSNGWSDPYPIWIWESDPEVNPREGDIVTFQKNFDIPGVPADSELKIAVDNGYAVWINDHFIGCDNLLEGISVPLPKTEAEFRDALEKLTQDYVDTTTWQEAKTFTINKEYLNKGNNVLTILAVNEYCDTDDSDGRGGNNPLATTENGLNPAGVAFCLKANWNEIYKCTTNSESAWGKGFDFGGSNWAMFIRYNNTPAPTYRFSVWAANIYKDNPAVLQFKFGDDVIGTMDLSTISPPLDTWKEFKYDFTRPVGGQVKIQIIDTFVIAQGNDFALDDISLIIVQK
jgi:hypothetical protein